jgi:hypothetical protein
MSAPIKITADNAAKINAVLAEANGKATSHTIRSWVVVDSIATDAESRLSALPKAERAGATLVHTPAGPSAKSYKYAAATTRLRMERRASGWFLTSAERAEVYPRAQQRDSMTITPEQRDEIARRAVAEYNIRQEETV